MPALGLNSLSSKSAMVIYDGQPQETSDRESEMPSKLPPSEMPLTSLDQTYIYIGHDSDASLIGDLDITQRWKYNYHNS